LINSGMSLKQALIYNLASASTCFAGFVIGVIVGEINRNFGQFIFALAGGMFLCISLAGMLAEINKKAEEEMKRNLRAGVNMMLLQTAGLATGLIIMYLFAEYGSMISF
uniref:ZIP family metal transporter n=1 Tax=Toxocara canis TaxID=6265 RepID=A0A183VHC6_TOXCA